MQTGWIVKIARMTGIGLLTASLGSARAFEATPAPAASPLTQTDADAWLDGFMPFALARDNIAGAVIVIVKDGQVLTQRGFGFANVELRKPVDPANTLFRPGSVSKLFTWTAVMQLVERGKLDPDADINRYLDFVIPPFAGKPLTLRHLMTHRPGFEEVARGGIRYSGTVPPLGDVLKFLTPERVFAPGSTPAYSNYGAALAGYIVERVSGEPFDDYIDNHIFKPLGMTHSTFRQPLPASLAPFMAQGYPLATGPPKPFELISVPPAGSASISGADMARFMIAHLNQGAGLLEPETADLMHAPTTVSIAGTNRMALGFYEQQLNGRTAIAHGGDLNYFHSYLWLLPAEHVGLFVSMNSEGTGSTFGLRLAMFQEFGDRYFPSSGHPPVELPTAREHAKLLTGSYITSRGAFSTFLRAADLIGETKVGLDADGRPSVPDIFGGPPRRWIETAPFEWQDADGKDRLAASVENGQVVLWTMDSVSPFMVWIRPAWYGNAAWLLPAFVVSLTVVAIVALSWPIGAINRRRYGVALNRAGHSAWQYRAVPVLAWWVLGVIAGWAVLFALLISGAAADAVKALDWSIIALELTGTLGFVLLFAATLRSLWLSRSRGWLKVVGNAVFAASAGVLLWVGIFFHLINYGSKY